MTSPREFGEMLRRQRERRAVTLQAVAERTKIGSSMLKALERGDCSRWPGGIYSRAWIRAYAAAIGLDPDDIGAQFNRCFGSIAFPEGQLAAATQAANADLPPITPVRMSLAPDPDERARVLARRAALFLADLLLAAAAAAVVSLLTVLSFGTLFASAAVLCHAVGLFGGGGSAAGWIERSARRHARHHADASGESAVAEAA